ncbi:hypothetical protein IW01_08695 [Pectobacterium brasiliense]|nr:hypothetical protein IW01_08695 [Pectobacterium brasiliense]KHT41008.1 hypothetical protein RD02_11545 [Pectobacterium brasiliense]
MGINFILNAPTVDDFINLTEFKGRNLIQAKFSETTSMECRDSEQNIFSDNNSLIVVQKGSYSPEVSFTLGRGANEQKSAF